MRSQIPRLAHTSVLLAAAIVCGCQSGGSDSNVVSPPAPVASITVSLASSSVTVTQGTSGTVAVTVARNNGYSGSVDLTVEGAPTGVTATIPATLPAGASGGTLAIAVAPAVAPASYSLTVRGHGQEVSDNTASLTLVVTAAGGFSLSVSPASVSLPQAGRATVTIDVNRTGGFTEAVALSVTGVPAEMGAMPLPAIATGASSTLSIVATSAALPGTFTLTVHGTATGLAEQTATLSVQVTPIVGTTVTFKFCSDVPIWFATQSDAGVWTQQTSAAGNVYSFSVGTRGGIAATMRTDGAIATTVMYATASELVAIGQSTIADCVNPSRGNKALSGTVTGLDGGQIASIALGDASTSTQGSGLSTYALEGAPDLASDLVAARQTEQSLLVTTDRLILRRGMNLPSGSAIPLLDFAAGESFAPATATATVTGTGGDLTALGNLFITGTHTVLGLSGAEATSAQSFLGVPSAQMAAGDIHQLFAVAMSADWNTARGATTYFRAVGDRSLSLGPEMAVPTITTVSDVALRLRTQLPLQPEYSTQLSIDFWQPDASPAGSHDIVLDITAGYLGGSPTTWDVTIPDLSGAGFNSSWTFSIGGRIDWDLVVANAPSLLWTIGHSEPEGTSYGFAERSSSGATLSAHPGTRRRRGSLNRALAALRGRGRP